MPLSIYMLKLDMGSLVGLIIVVPDIIAIVDLFRSAKGTGKKIIWLILIIILPLLGVIIYFLLRTGKQPEENKE
jgi:hypothetical protein